MKIPITHLSIEHKVEVKTSNLGYREKKLPYPRGYFKQDGLLKRRVVCDNLYFDFIVRKLTKEEL